MALPGATSPSAERGMILAASFPYTIKGLCLRNVISLSFVGLAWSARTRFPEKLNEKHSARLILDIPLNKLLNVSSVLERHG